MRKMWSRTNWNSDLVPSSAQDKEKGQQSSEKEKKLEEMPIVENSKQHIITSLNDQASSYNHKQHIITSLNDQASSYNYKGEYSKAEPLHKQALAIYRGSRL